MLTAEEHSQRLDALRWAEKHCPDPRAGGRLRGSGGAMGLRWAVPRRGDIGAGCVAGRLPRD